MYVRFAYSWVPFAVWLRVVFVTCFFLCCAHSSFVFVLFVFCCIAMLDLKGDYGFQMFFYFILFAYIILFLHMLVLRERH